MKIHQVKRILILICFFLLPVIAFAQGNPPPDPGGDPDVPIDGSVSALLIAGVLYGSKKLKEKRIRQID